MGIGQVLQMAGTSFGVRLCSGLPSWEPESHSRCSPQLRQRAANYGIHKTTEAITRDLLIHETEKDPILKDIITYLHSHWPEQTTLTRGIHAYFKIWKQLHYQDGLLLKNDCIVTSFRGPS